MERIAVILDRSVGQNGLLTGGVIRADQGWFTSPAQAAIVVTAMKGPGRNLGVVGLDHPTMFGQVPDFSDTQPIYLILREAPLDMPTGGRSNFVEAWGFDHELAREIARQKEHATYLTYVDRVRDANMRAVLAHAREMAAAANKPEMLDGGGPFPAPPNLHKLLTEDEWRQGLDAKGFPTHLIVSVGPHREG